MELPFQLPRNNLSLEVSSTEKELLSKLKSDIPFFLLFLKYAAEDGMWRDSHSDFISESISWITEEFLNRKLSNATALALKQIIYDNQLYRKGYVNENLKVKGAHGEWAFNSLLLEVESSYFNELIQKNKPIELTFLPDAFLSLFHECIHTNSMNNLYKYEKKELFQFLQAAEEFKLKTMSKEIQEVLKRYISDENVVGLLLESHEHSWEYFKDACCIYLNNKHWGVRLFSTHPHLNEIENNPFVFELLDFNETALKVFQKVKDKITHFICAYTDHPQFSEVIHEIPHLIFLDIGRSRMFPADLHSIPPHFIGLDLSQCAWLKDEQFKKIIAAFPYLKVLILQSNVQLTYQSFGDIYKLRELQGIDLSRCHIRDEDFALLIRGNLKLHFLSLAECKHLTHRSFFEIGRHLTHLLELNVERCDLSDGMLMEIVTHCRELQSLNLNKCTFLTEKGLISSIKQGVKLQKLQIKDLNLSEKTLNFLKETIPIVIDK